MTVADESRAVEIALDDVVALGDVAASLGRDKRARILDEVASRRLADAPPVRPGIAARLLGVSEPTVRSWVERGILQAVSRRPRLLLDPESVLTLRDLVDELRAVGQDRNLAEALSHRLADEHARRSRSAAVARHDAAWRLSGPAAPLGMIDRCRWRSAVPLPRTS